MLLVDRRKIATTNSSIAKLSVCRRKSSLLNSFLLTKSSELWIKYSAIILTHRQLKKRYNKYRLNY
jgi:hypothetical protein